MVNIVAAELIRRLDIEERYSHVLLNLAIYADRHTALCNPSRTTEARDLKVCTKTVQRRHAVLETLKLIEIIENPDGGRSSQKVMLNITKLKEYVDTGEKLRGRAKPKLKTRTKCEDDTLRELVAESLNCPGRGDTCVPNPGHIVSDEENQWESNQSDYVRTHDISAQQDRFGRGLGKMLEAHVGKRTFDELFRDCRPYESKHSNTSIPILTPTKKVESEISNFYVDSFERSFGLKLSPQYANGQSAKDLKTFGEYLGLD